MEITGRLRGEGKLPWGSAGEEELNSTGRGRGCDGRREEKLSGDALESGASGQGAQDRRGNAVGEGEADLGRADAREGREGRERAEGLACCCCQEERVGRVLQGNSQPGLWAAHHVHLRGAAPSPPASALGDAGLRLPELRLEAGSIGSKALGGLGWQLCR